MGMVIGRFVWGEPEAVGLRRVPGMKVGWESLVRKSGGFISALQRNSGRP